MINNFAYHPTQSRDRRPCSAPPPHVPALPLHLRAQANTGQMASSPRPSSDQLLLGGRPPALTPPPKERPVASGRTIYSAPIPITKPPREIKIPPHPPVW